ncbi:precorrin-6A reductase [Bacillota bacterium LX-D]|nr:precorrin-6A reductase [Bacillota bacterium LX-D]
MILVLGGTKEANELIRELQSLNCRVLVTTVSSYGGELAKSCGAEEVLVDALEEQDLVQLVKEKKIEILIDATHPYATAISQLARTVSAKCGVKYFRYTRPECRCQNDCSKVIWVNTYEQAAETAFKLGNTVLATIGSKNLEYFVRVRGPEQRLIVRVLPELASVAQCRNLGIQPKDILAIQGPFSETMNKLIFSEFGVEVIVSKESGKSGGFDTKLSAAESLGLPMVIIRRPKENLTGQEFFSDLSKLLQVLKGDLK